MKTIISTLISLILLSGCGGPIDISGKYHLKFPYKEVNQRYEGHLAKYELTLDRDNTYSLVYIYPIEKWIKDSESEKIRTLISEPKRTIKGKYKFIDGNISFEGDKVLSEMNKIVYKNNALYFGEHKFEKK